LELKIYKEFCLFFKNLGELTQKRIHFWWIKLRIKPHYILKLN